MKRWIEAEVRYRRAMRKARLAHLHAVDRGGRNWTREDLYERVRTR